MNKDEEEIYGGCFISHFYVFILETEYLFVNIMGTLSDSRQGSECSRELCWVSASLVLFYMLYFTG